MLIKVILSYIFGYIRIQVEGYYIERFMNLCNNKKLVIWNIEKIKNTGLILNIRIQDMKEIREICQKTKCKCKIIYKKGMPFIIKKYKKRKIFFIILLMLIIAMYISSMFVWNIEIQIDENNQLENIENDIQEAGLKKGVLKNNINVKEIINKIRLKRDDIAWVGIKLKGTNAIIEIVKATEKPEIVDENDICNIVANKNGVITKISATKGTAQVKVGDTVSIDEILIGGWMEGKYTGVRYVHAEGEIEAIVPYTKSKKILYNSIEIEETGNEEKKYSIKFNNFKINLFKKLSKFKIYDTIEVEKNFQLFSNFYLPISIIEITNKEKKEVEKTYTKLEAIEIGKKELEQELDNEIENKEAISSKDVTVEEKEDGVEIFVTYNVFENIGRYEKNVNDEQ